MHDKSLVDLHEQLNSLFGVPMVNRKTSNLMLIVSSVVSVVASIIAIACCAVSYVSSSSVTNLQRETDALRNRVDVAEAYINNLNQRVK